MLTKSYKSYLLGLVVAGLFWAVNTQAAEEVVLSVKASDWQDFKEIADGRVEDDYLTGEVIGQQPRITSGSLGPIAAKEVSSIVVRIGTTHGGRIHLYWASEEEPNFSDERMHHWFTVPADGEIHEISVETDALKNWRGDINRLRIDPGAYSDSTGNFVLEALELRKK